MKNKGNIISLIIMGVIVAIFAVLYFVLKDMIYLKVGLLAIGALNIVNGFVAVKNNMTAVGVIYLVGGAALVIVMAISLFI